MPGGAVSPYTGRGGVGYGAAKGNAGSGGSQSASLSDYWSIFWQQFSNDLGGLSSNSSIVASTPSAAKPSAATPSTPAGPSSPNVPTGFDLNNQLESQRLQKYYNYYIWTGDTQSFGRGKETGDQLSKPVPTKASDYLLQWEQNGNTAEVTALQNRLVAAGLLNKQYVGGGWNSQTEDALSQAMQQSANHPNDPTYTVDSYINQRAAYNERNGVNRNDFTKTSTEVDLTNPTQAKGMLYQTLTQYLGHMPTDAEVKQFTATLNAAERANPATVTTHYERDPVTGMPMSKSAVKSGGYDAATAAIDYARAQPGSAEFQAATSYMDAFKSALKG